MSFLSSFPIAVLAGFLLGTMTGLGLGGGSLLMLWLTAALSVPPDTARQINLLFFFPTALVSCLIHLKQGILPLRKLFPARAAGCLAAAAASVLRGILNETAVKYLTAALFLSAGIRELFYRDRDAR